MQPAPVRNTAVVCKVAGPVRQHLNAGRPRIQEATPGSAQRHERDEIKNYLREVCGPR